MWSVAFCPKCGLSGECYCRCLGSSILDRSYEYVFICKNCGHTKMIKESGGCWSGPSAKCPFCGKNCNVHQEPPKEFKIPK